MKTIVINLISGPCAGKSTAAAGIFSALKKQGIECELALEYAKDCVWDESFYKMKD
jgi:tRNA uridine 5-carbamoylmethylation protein Kti12